MPGHQSAGSRCKPPPLTHGRTCCRQRMSSGIPPAWKSRGGRLIPSCSTTTSEAARIHCGGAWGSFRGDGEVVHQSSMAAERGGACTLSAGGPTQNYCTHIIQTHLGGSAAQRTDVRHRRWRHGEPRAVCRCCCCCEGGGGGGGGTLLWLCMARYLPSSM